MHVREIVAKVNGVLQIEINQGIISDDRISNSKILGTCQKKIYFEDGTKREVGQNIIYKSSKFVTSVNLYPINIREEAPGSSGFSSLTLLSLYR